MSIESVLDTIISTNAGVQALISSGSPPNVRFWAAGNLPQDSVLPAATYQTIAGAPANVFETAPADNKRIQIDCWSMQFDNAQAIEEAIRDALEDQDVLTANGIGAKCVSFNGNDFDPDTRRYRASSDWSFWMSR